ncbi:prolycopene isomerase, chloroplastic isoform X2 [Selaginella moellendorffii]|uniref:prolycopene isomerase, chloroplastic isoform X2 n=1 Tax=Selaginella moellendorffii TaxID=88036 RepID=UPI000D1CE7A2|nr:prolycopene isomerase, chloroplastic isoform X2 [Selaginella moellendorffii]|eukprot:XP_024520535.1 prolycopene isomerase, chloroplastic isoform X2 [Selaginella moellendorffii]
MIDGRLGHLDWMASLVSAPSVVHTIDRKGLRGKAGADYVVIGSGIGGLSCGGLLARYGEDVVVLESHTLAGGAAHSFQVGGYRFDSGPSLFSGLSSKGPQANPLAQVLDALGERVECAKYDSWMVHLPQGSFLSEIGPSHFPQVLSICTSLLVSVYQVLEKYGGSNAVAEWKRLQETVLGLSEAAMALPPAALRGDWGALFTVLGRYSPQLISSFMRMGFKGALNASRLLGPFSEILDALEIKDPFLRNWLDLLPFLLSGLKADGTLAAEVVYMFSEWYKPGCMLEYPHGGTEAIIDALVRGLEKHNGQLSLGCHVEQILVENGRAKGVKLRNGQVVVARKAVISNASIWNTVALLPPKEVPQEYQKRATETPQCDSFMHLHLGVEAKDLPADLGIHHIVVDSWEQGVDAPQNVVLISMPSALSPNLAPPGKHVLHAYTPGTEPYHLWKGLDRQSAAYKQLKEERSQVMWKAVQRALGTGFSADSCDVKLVGTPLTHERFLRRHRGTYGPAIRAGKDTFPGPETPIKNLFCCGDSVFPGIGVPAVAASGMLTANSLVSVDKHTQLLDAIGL